uniref:Ubiquitin-like domain-containing protein n=2 Tax=Hemiselmis andersenii TaxID=464988 RepID=A0A6U5CP30_HEMAN|mmetsp:Transcript_7980/g.19550  ORF Transcript_7980/g.19550 Transcript_7980/m.19550 type:complete len:595 (+) Transcript_7980:56-1840(+)
MQIFLKLPSARTVVVPVEGGDSVAALTDKVFDIEGISSEHQRLVFGGKQLEESASLAASRISDGGTVHVLLRGMLGGAARAKKEAEAAKHKQEMEEEYQSWHALSDQTATTGIMRVLCVSLVLENNKEAIHGTEDAPDNGFVCGPSSDAYEPEFGQEVEDETLNYWTGWPSQEGFIEAFAEIRDKFFEIWEDLEPLDGQPSTAPPAEFWKKTEQIYVIVECGELDGIWYNGPRKIYQKDDPSNELWDFEALCIESRLWFKPAALSSAHAGLAYPWRIDGEFAELERWFYHGIGTTTYYTPTNYRVPDSELQKDGDAKKALTIKRPGGWVQWSQMDLSGVLAMTDREKMRLRQMYQLTKKQSLGGKRGVLDADEKDLLVQVELLVETGPMHNPQVGVFQWQIKSLKKQLSHKCVFWSNTEDHLPNGSVADGTKTAEEDEDKQGKGIELMEFWKYEQKIGTLRKKYIMEDRQRLMDTIETFTPTYKAIIKNKGQDEDDGDGDHYMTEDNQRMITNIVALAMDTHMPDHPEDKIACFIKTLIEQRIGPTWHVLVGRSMGYAIQCEARHFLHMFMQHLAFIIWKSEPDPNSGGKTVQG